jgi:hypothetical protein
MNTINLIEMQESFHPHSENQSVINVSDHSKAWQWILSSYQTVVENSEQINSQNRLECLYNLTEVCCVILGKLDTNLILSKYKILISFFGKGVCRITEKILTDLNMIKSQYSEALEVGFFFLF